MGIEERFWSKVNRGPDCWVWMAGKTGSGYGQFWMEGRDRCAHRVAYELEYGSIRYALQVLHSCDNPPCVNPEHLFLGTQKDNMMDASKKGRINTDSICGSNHGQAKLTEHQVRVILTDTRLHREIAEDYGVCRRTISGIKSGKGWKHLHS